MADYPIGPRLRAVRFYTQILQRILIFVAAMSFNFCSLDQNDNSPQLKFAGG